MSHHQTSQHHYSTTTITINAQSTSDDASTTEAPPPSTLTMAATMASSLPPLMGGDGGGGQSNMQLAEDFLFSTPASLDEKDIYSIVQWIELRGSNYGRLYTPILERIKEPGFNCNTLSDHQFSVLISAAVGDRGSPWHSLRRDYLHNLLAALKAKSVQLGIESYNELFLAKLANDEPVDVLKFLAHLESKRLEPNERTFEAVCLAYAKCKPHNPTAIIGVLKCLTDANQPHTPTMINALAYAEAANGHFDNVMSTVEGYSSKYGVRTVPLLLNAALAFAEQGDLDNVLRTLSHLPTSEDITQTHNARLLFDIYMALLKNGRLDALEQFAGYLGLTSEMRLSGGLNGAYINRHLVALRESGNTPAIAQLLQIAPLEFLGQDINNLTNLLANDIRKGFLSVEKFIELYETFKHDPEFARFFSLIDAIKKLLYDSKPELMQLYEYFLLSDEASAYVSRPHVLFPLIHAIANKPTNIPEILRAVRIFNELRRIYPNEPNIAKYAESRVIFDAITEAFADSLEADDYTAATKLFALHADLPALDFKSDDMLKYAQHLTRTHANDDFQELINYAKYVPMTYDKDHFFWLLLQDYFKSKRIRFDTYGAFEIYMKLIGIRDQSDPIREVHSTTVFVLLKRAYEDLNETGNTGNKHHYFYLSENLTLISEHTSNIYISVLEQIEREFSILERCRLQGAVLICYGDKKNFGKIFERRGFNVTDEDLQYVAEIGVNAEEERIGVAIGGLRKQLWSPRIRPSQKEIDEIFTM